MSNVLLVTIDSLRADHVGHLGYDRNTTPNIDDLAASGTYCTNAFAHACSTRPSFPSILTSAYALMYGGYERVSSDQTLVSEVFEDAGYRTAGFHSNLYLSKDFGYDRGFGTFYDSKTDPSPTAKIRQKVKDWLDEDGLAYGTLARAFEIAERQAGANIGSAYVSAADVTDMAIDWISSRDGDDPSFLWVHYMDVHHPYVPPAEHQMAFRDEPIEEREAIKLRRKMIEEPDAITDDELAKLIDLYDAEIRYADAEIGRLVAAAVDTWGEDTATLVTSDHGEEFREHGGFSHHATFYDEVIHVPFVLNRTDEKEANRRCDELVGLLDVSPTLVDAAGLEVPTNWYGKSLLEMLDGQGWPRDEIIGDWKNTDTGEERFCVRSHDWKYIVTDEREYLYSLADDPNETENVLSSHPDVAASMQDVLAEHRREVEDTRLDLGAVEMEEGIKERLRDLGYQE